MNAKIKNKLNRIVFLLNGFLFLLGGIVLIDETKWTFGVLHFLGSALNLGMIIKFENKKTKEIIEYAVLAVNVVVSLAIAIDYQLAGKAYIQYAWLMAAIMSSVALGIHIKRRKAIPDLG